MKAYHLRAIRLVVVAFAVLVSIAPDSGALKGGNALADNIPQADVGAWHDTGVIIQEKDYSVCFDPKHPDNVLVTNGYDTGILYDGSALYGSGTVTYNLVSGERRQLSAHHFDYCGPGGLLYSLAGPGNISSDKTRRFSSDDPEGTLIEYQPTYIAQDGTLHIYSFPQAGQSALLYSPDGGLTWYGRSAHFGDRLASIAVSSVDARSIYALVYDSEPPRSLSIGASYHVYFSSDAGLHWVQGGSLQTPTLEDDEYQVVDIKTLPGRGVPVDTLMVSISTGFGASHSGGTQRILLSGDGARSFQEVLSPDSTEYNESIEFFHTSEGVLRATEQVSFRAPTLELTTDAGKTWNALPLPFTVQAPFLAYPRYYILPDAPSVIFAWRENDSERQDTHFSTDGGHSWTENTWAGIYGLWGQFTPFLPLTVLQDRDGHLYTLEIPFVGKSLLHSVIPDRVADGSYFPQTGHNLFGTFRQYWDAHGGLAQFGYPITDPFSEVSQTDGKAYTVQYFERGEFELHPENTVPYDVLQSLLGVRAYRQRYGEASARGQHASTDNPLYFPETGHAIGGKFRAYWGSHGGLAQQGYPISDEFTEVSSADGKPYTVQYFQRAEFELHPENAGSPNEVLLSPLGLQQFNASYNAVAAQP